MQVSLEVLRATRDRRPVPHLRRHSIRIFYSPALEVWLSLHDLIGRLWNGENESQIDDPTVSWVEVARAVDDERVSQTLCSALIRKLVGMISAHSYFFQALVT